MDTGNPKVIGDMNKNAILKILRKDGPLSKAQIARRLNISFPSVSSNVKVLLDAGLIEEVGHGDNSLGRKSTLLAFNANRGFVVGVDVGRSKIVAMCSNLNGEIKGTSKREGKVSNEGRYILEQICHTITDVISVSHTDINSVNYICIGIPGIIDEEKGKNFLAPFMASWEDLKIKEYIEEKFDCNVIIDNSVNLGAIGEKWKGAARGYKNISYVSFGIGIGAALILNNELYRGMSNTAGEVGFMTLDKYYLRRQFREEGVLEEMISTSSIVDSVKKIKGYENELTMEDVFNMADSGDEIAKKLLGELVVYFGMLLINISCTVNPEVIVIAGKVGKAVGERYRLDLENMLTAHVPYPPKILISDLGDKANVLGAIASSIRYVNSSYENLIY